MRVRVGARAECRRVSGGGRLGRRFPDAERIAGSVEGVVGDDRKWLVSREGVVIVFDSTEFPPAGAGEHQVVVPFNALKEFIRPDGPVARFVK